VERTSGPGPAAWSDEPAGIVNEAHGPEAAEVARAAVQPVGRHQVVTTLTSASPSGAPSAAASAALVEIRRLLAGHTDRAEEGRILGILRSAAPADLNHILAGLDLHEAISDMDDRLMGPKNRTALFRLLSQERLGDLSVDSRARLISAVQRHSTDGGAEKLVRDVFLGTRGRDLTALKNAIDEGGDVYDLHKLLFDDIDDRSVRTAILGHFRNESASAPSGELKVLSDIDDTFYANLKDTRFPKGTVYPGVRSFYEELDRGSAAKPGRTGDLTFLTARPEDELHAIETATLGMLKGKGVTRATVLGGDFAHAIGNERIAEGKLARFEEFKSCYPEYGFVFVGDSGQGDAIFGEKMLARDPRASRAAFIHDVVATPPARRAELAARNVVMFDTYAGAAVEAFDRGLIGREGLERVARSAVKELASVRFATPEQKALRMAELRSDLARVNQRLPSDRAVSLP